MPGTSADQRNAKLGTSMKKALPRGWYIIQQKAQVQSTLPGGPCIFARLLAKAVILAQNVPTRYTVPRMVPQRPASPAKAMPTIAPVDNFVVISWHCGGVFFPRTILRYPEPQVQYYNPHGKESASALGKNTPTAALLSLYTKAAVAEQWLRAKAT